MKATPDQFMASLGLPKVYRVGGSVRDELLGRHAKDSDYVVCGAHLGEIKDALVAHDAKPKSLKLRDGRQVGWRAAVRGFGLVEIVMPRTEKSTGPGHGDFVIIADPELSLTDDATRRDFTINALYRNVITGQVLDPLSRGRTDLRFKLINTTHPDSFRDDPLRTLRALRFISQLEGFVLSAQCENEMERHADAVTGLTDKGVSGTALDELSKLLMGGRPGIALRWARDTGVLPVILPELEPMLGFEQRSHYHTKTTDEHTFDALQAAANMHDAAPLRVRWALLFHDSGKPESAWVDFDGKQHYYRPARPVYNINKYGVAGPQVGENDSIPDDLSIWPEDHEVIGARLADKALKRLNTPKRLRSDVVTLVARHMLPLHENVKPFKVRKWRAEIGDDMLRDLIVHRLADVIGKGGDVDDAIDVLGWVERERCRAESANVPKSVNDLPVRGQDLLEMGLKGREIGEMQQKLLHEALSTPQKAHDRDWMLSRVQKLSK